MIINKQHNSSSNMCMSMTLLLFIILGIILIILGWCWVFSIVFTNTAFFYSKYINSAIANETWPCDIFVIYRNTLKCSYFGFSLEIFTWTIILMIFIIILSGIVYGLWVWCTNVPVWMKKCLTTFKSYFFVNMYSNITEDYNINKNMRV